MHFYKRHIGDYAKDTGHLSLIEHGVYAVLLDWSYATERALPEDNDQVYRLCRAVTAAEKRAVDSVVKEFFQSTSEGRLNKRVVNEVGQNSIKSTKCSDAALKLWQSKRNASADASALQTQSHARARPLTINHNPLKEEGVGNFPESVSDEAVIEFGKGFRGEVSSGAPAIPDDWVVDFLKKINGRREWPRDWRKWMVACWRADFRTWKLPGAGIEKRREKPGGEVSASVAEIAKQKRRQELNEELRELVDEIESLVQAGAEVPREKTTREREIRKEISE